MVGPVEHVTVHELERTLRASEKTACWLCDHENRSVYWGLATLGIAYPGPTRFICDDCVKKIKAV